MLFDVVFILITTRSLLALIVFHPETTGKFVCFHSAANGRDIVERWALYRNSTLEHPFVLWIVTLLGCLFTAHVLSYCMHWSAVTSAPQAGEVNSTDHRITGAPVKGQGILAGMMGKPKDLSYFDDAQIVMARQLGLSEYLRMQWLVPTKSGPRQGKWWTLYLQQGHGHGSMDEGSLVCGIIFLLIPMDSRVHLSHLHGEAMAPGCTIRRTYGQCSTGGKPCVLAFMWVLLWHVLLA